MTRRERLISILTFVGATLLFASITSFGATWIWGGRMMDGWILLLLGIIALLAGVALSLAHPERPEE